LEWNIVGPFFSLLRIMKNYKIKKKYIILILQTSVWIHYHPLRSHIISRFKDQNIKQFKDRYQLEISKDQAIKNVDFSIFRKVVIILFIYTDDLLFSYMPLTHYLSSF
jgi:hypothetical protein